MTVGVVSHFTDLVFSEFQDYARSLVHHVLRIRFQPAPLPDLHDHAVVAIVPLTPHVLVAPVGGAQALLAVLHRADDRVASSPFPADRRRAGAPVDDVRREVSRHFVHLPGEQGLLVGFRHVHALAHRVTPSGMGTGFALRPARSIGLSISALCSSWIIQKSTARVASSRDAWASPSLILTWRTLFSMSSASQPRECAMKG